MTQSKPSGMQPIASNQKPNKSMNYKQKSTELKHSASSSTQRHKKKLLTIGVALLGLGGLMVVDQANTNAIHTSYASQTLTLPDAPVRSLASETTQNANTTQEKSAIVAPGQTLSTVGQELGIAYHVITQMAEHDTLGKSFTSLQPGDELSASFDANNNLSTVSLTKKSSAEQFIVDIEHGEVMGGTSQTPSTEKRIRVVAGEINSSLYGAGTKAGISPRVINKLTKIFGYDIDFAQDLRKGDHFSLVFEELYREGERVGSGEIIAASFVNQGKEHVALQHTFLDGHTAYFGADGRPLKKNFLRMPIEFARLSSNYGVRRHPILGRMKMHTGVDYAAKTGTPIMSAGDGKVTYTGWRGGYGRTVIVDHGNGHSTLYAHMSKFGKFKTGAKVRQGETIGYVGSTGRSTGPHLHYEFRVNGVHKNPLKVTLPKPEPLPATEMARFKPRSQQMLARMKLVDERTRFATIQ